MMWMFFHTQISDTVLFKWWKVETVGSLLITCLIMYFGGICFEAIKWLRLVLEQQSRQLITTNAGSNQATQNTTIPVINRRYSECLLSRVHLLQTVLFTVQLLLSYLLMLCFMTFSVWIGVAICAGAATGFWLFGNRAPMLAFASAAGGTAIGQGYASTGRTELH